MEKTKLEHLVIIIDNNKKIEPKLYSCLEETKTTGEAVKAAKQAYEKAYGNKEYESYHFIH